MKRVAVAAVVVLVLATGASSASARPQQAARSQGVGASVAAGILSKVAEAGAKAAIAQFAPDLTKYVDPTSAQLADIQNQLAELDAKITEIKLHLDALPAKINCSTQRAALGNAVAKAQTSLESLMAARLLVKNDPKTGKPSPELTFEARTKRLDDLYSQQFTNLEADQLQIHSQLIGHDGLIVNCAKTIEDGLYPYLTSVLAEYVRDFYAEYKNAMAALLVVRSNLMLFKSDRYHESEIKTLGKRIQDYVKTEETFIKPAFPDTQSYDKRTKWLYEVKLVTEESEKSFLRSHGWHVTGLTTTPTCSAIENFIRGSGLRGHAALDYLQKINALVVPRFTSVIFCDDDSDRPYLWSLTEYSYHQAPVPPRVATVAAIQHRVYPIIGDYSYTGGR